VRGSVCFIGGELTAKTTGTPRKSSLKKMVCAFRAFLWLTPSHKFMDALNFFELEQLAKENLPQTAYDFYRSGAWDEVTLRENREAFERILVHYRVCVDVSRRDLSTMILGQKISVPILIAPTAFHRLATPDGELATVRAAGSAGTMKMLSRRRPARFGFNFTSTRTASSRVRWWRASKLRAARH
jgi:4-hydroxymandelate oxidase